MMSSRAAKQTSGERDRDDDDQRRRDRRRSAAAMPRRLERYAEAPLIAPAPATRRRRPVVRRLVVDAVALMRDDSRSAESATSPAGSGSTSDRSRAECTDRSSSSAIRAPATPGRDRARRHRSAPSVPMTPVNSAPHNSANTITGLRRRGRELLDEDVDADMDAGAHAERGAEFRHPHEHVGGELLRPGQIDRGEREVDPVRGDARARRGHAAPPRWRAPRNCWRRSDARRRRR